MAGSCSYFFLPFLSPDGSGDFGRIGEPRVELAKDEKRGTNFHDPSQRYTFVWDGVVMC